jgi:glutathione reductase (NADPH)
MAEEFDYIVIGAGSGGMGSGRRAALHGKKVAMLENRVIGGTCVNVGCVPKKVMLNLASYLEEASLFKDYGVNGTEGLSLDFPAFKIQRDNYVKKLNGIYEKNVANAGISYFKGTGSFVDAKTIQTSEGKTLTAPHIMICSGSTPQTPVVDGGEHCWSSDDIFSMEELPKSIVVLGGGYIGVEMAQILHALGSKTTLLVRNKMLAGHCDQELIPVLQTCMEKLGMDCRLGTPFTKVEKLESGMLRVHLQDGGHVDAEKVLAALGRPPNVDPLKLENAGVAVAKGAVVVDEF